ncbi:MAG: hypothetical protein ACI9W4_000640 [Rhodothermales bacterium]
MTAPERRHWWPSVGKRPGRRIPWAALLRFALAAVVLVLVARSVDLAEMRSALATADYRPAVPALALAAVQLLSGGLLWLWLARAQDSQIKFVEALKAYVGSHAVAIWTPGRAADYAARPQLMPRGSRRTWAVAVAVEALIRHPVPLGMAAAAALAWFAFTGVEWFAAAAVGVCVVSLLPILWPPLLVRFVRPLGFEGRLEFLDRLGVRDRVGLMLGHGLRYAILGLQFGLLVKAMAPDSGPLLILSAGALITLCLKLLLPLLSFAELGIREGAAVLVFGTLGIAPEAALNASLMIYAVNVLLPAAVGSVVWLRQPRRVKSERESPGSPEQSPDQA